jgi:UDP-GlcNAc:undecaprenyl-phosphate/decaprenyl-phosphate GlcNAc-1-phosphate transferase
VLVSLIVAFCVTLGMSLLLTPFVIKIAPLVGAMDKPNERKVHQIPTPRLGGLAIFFSFFSGIVTLCVFHPAILSASWIFQKDGIILFGTLFLVLCLGVWDDIRSLKPGQKFIVQLALSIIIYFTGFTVSGITSLFGMGTTAIGLLDFPLTVIWIIGVTNALNLIDGLDGLAAGVSTIVAMTMLPISLLQEDMGTAALALLIVGSLIGFLRYNFNPAKIFLGDSGSLFLGFLLSVLSVKGSTKSSTSFAILVPILALGFPIMETLLSMIRRFLRSFLPDKNNPENLILRLKSMFQPDSSHIHHRLIGRGLSHRNAVLMLYIVSCGLGVGAFLITVSNNLVASLVLIVVGAATIIGVNQLKYKEMAVLQNGVLLPLYDKPIMNVEMFQVFFDIAAILISFTLAQVLSGCISVNEISWKYIPALLIGVTAAQFLVFWLSGMYKRTFQIFGVGDVIGTIKGIVGAVTTTAIILFVLPDSIGHKQLAALVIDFFFLSVIVLGVRTSFHVLSFLSHRGAKDGKKVLIYGADPNGMMMLARMLEANIATWTPIGFLDDNPSLEGKTLNGYPIYGSHWKLQKLIREQVIDEIVICSETIKPEALRRMRNIARQKNISIKRIRVLYEDFHEDPQGKSVSHVFQPHNDDLVFHSPEQRIN